MKRVFSFLLIIAILCTLSVPCFAANPSVSVKAPNAVVGETITVTVNLSANSGLAGLRLIVNFNSSEFQLISGSAKESTLLFSDKPVEEMARIKYTGVSNRVVNSSGTIMTFKLKVLKTGGKISINIIEALDGENNKVSVGTTSATVKCSHANAKWIVTKNATCTEKGSEIRECTCGDKSTRDIPSKHQFGEWTIVKEATETEKGTKERICKVCDKKETVEIPMLSISETLSETETQSETQTENEVTTIPQNQDTNKTDAKPIVIGAIFFVVGIAVGIGTTLFIIKRKAKEEE